MSSAPSLHGSASGFFKSSSGQTVEIRDVWASNLEEEMHNIREIIERYPYVAMDTEFPGVVARPEQHSGTQDLGYLTLKFNVDLLRLIQLGLSFTDGQGNWAEGCTCWQFNFKFSLNDDMFAQDSIDLLKKSGIDFEAFENYGIDIQYFGELMMMSGLVLSDEVKWLTFHCSYDFGYLLKTLTCEALPEEESTFMDMLKTYFPNIYDVKYMMTLTDGLHGGLSGLAESLQVERIGPMHQAGSDSLLTAQTFFALRKKLPIEDGDDTKYRGELYGLGTNHTKYKSKGYAGGGMTTPVMQPQSGVHFGTGAAGSYPFRQGGGYTGMEEAMQEGY